MLYYSNLLKIAVFFKLKCRKRYVRDTLFTYDKLINFSTCKQVEIHSQTQFIFK